MAKTARRAIPNFQRLNVKSPLKRRRPLNSKLSSVKAGRG